MTFSRCKNLGYKICNLVVYWPLCGYEIKNWVRKFIEILSFMIQVKIEWVVKNFMISCNQNSVIYHDALLRDELFCYSVTRSNIKRYFHMIENQLSIAWKISKLLCNIKRRRLSLLSTFVNFDLHRFFFLIEIHTYQFG